ncbi:MAG: VWA domain-containing protein [Paracoccus sp. (in: a-proteobacteria)]|nr:VWA domain-containing protein [Paracoccus sp. (in: a-proteobacteria)]
MTNDPQDEFDRLAAALRAAPRPDAALKRAAMARAMENFDALAKESASGMRPSQDRPPKRAGFLTGVRQMLSNLTSKQALAATSSVAAICVGLFVILPMQQGPEPRGIPQSAPETAGTNAPAVSEIPADALLNAEPTAEMALPSSEATTRSGATRSRVSPQPLSPPSLVTSASPALAGYILPASTDSFANADPNPVKITADEPVSTFSADVDTASYAIIRRFLLAGSLPPPEAVRIEEMVNYFPYEYAPPMPDDTAPFRASVDVMPTPWNEGTQLVRIGLQGKMPETADRPPLNLVFLIDTSGSMNFPDKLPLLKQSLRLMLGQLRPEDQVAMVAYASAAGEVLPPTPAGEQAKILAALDQLAAGGATNGMGGLEQAYAMAESMTSDGEVSRILLATDGDFNVGLSDPEGLEGYIARKRDSGIYLSVLGFGMGNLQDRTMQALAQNGNGQAAYIDTLQEAQKVLVDQLTGALFPIADDVKLQVEWNPAEVAEYRLIGYETRALRREDFNNDKIDAGEIGAGHQVTALYEITAPGSPAILNDALRYQAAPAATGDHDELGFLRLRYKEPGEGASHLIEVPITQDGAADQDADFAAAIAGFGQLLTGATYLGDWGWDDAIALAQSAKGDDPFGYRTEAISLMRLGQSLSAQAGGNIATPAGAPAEDRPLPELWEPLNPPPLPPVPVENGAPVTPQPAP